MNPQEQNPAGETPAKETGRIDLRIVYRVMIRAYLRHQMRQLPPTGKEVPRG